MIAGLWLVPVFPLAGFLLLVFTSGKLAKGAVASIGVGSVFLSALTALLVGIDFLATLGPTEAYTQFLWQWLSVAGLAPSLSLRLDSLSLVMMWVVTSVGLLIHLYASEYMAEDEGYSRFFAYMNLFLAAMLILVLADNLLFLYLGWEGVGLCSYLLIGFWYREPANGLAARKAFVMTRIGDVALLIGILLLATELGSLDIQTLLQRAADRWPVGSGFAVAAAALLLLGALGKSAQLPLQTWLPDAMAGPTPVSALIHAATMVTAGVYLIARLHGLYLLAPSVQTAIAVIGALTLLLAGISALAQTDLKRILAYSTISQIGYMFLALGVGAWSAAIFHFMTHAFFKALLFLSAGGVLLALHHQQDIFNMGGLRKGLPVAFWGFLIGAASLAALPLITAGFYSKDLILHQALLAPAGGPWLFAVGLAGSLLTALYAFRPVVVVFFGEMKTPVERRPGLRITIPLTVLGALALGSGFMVLPSAAGAWSSVPEFLSDVLPNAAVLHGDGAGELAVQVAASVSSLLGTGMAYLAYHSPPPWLQALRAKATGRHLMRLGYRGWDFDRFYQWALVTPWVRLAHSNREDLVDRLYRGVAALAEASCRLLSQSQTGRVRWYAASLAGGAVLLITISVFV